MTQDQVKEDQVKEKESKDEEEVPPDFGDHPPGAAVVGDDGGHPEYRHARQERARPVEHPLGDQPEGVIDDPITYPPDQLPPSLEEPEEPPPEEVPPEEPPPNGVGSFRP
jgi:hypothetical protein